MYIYIYIYIYIHTYITMFIYIGIINRYSKLKKHYPCAVCKKKVFSIKKN